MKVNYRFLIYAGLVCSVVSCTTTETVSNSSVSETISSTSIEAPAEPQADELYADLIKSDVKLSVVSSPAAIYVNKKFAKPFVFSVRHADNSAYADFDVEITYPYSKNKDIEFKTIVLKTDEEGLVTFSPESTAFAAITEVTAKPALLYDTEIVKNAADAAAVSAKYLVRSDIITKGAVLFIWDYNENGRPVNNSTHVQSEFRSRGITLVGNGPVNETSYIGRNAALYRDTYEIIGGDAYGYLISGAIKFTTPVTADGDEYYCALSAQITGIQMKDGSEIFSQTFTHEARGKNWAACTTKCKEELAKEIVDALIYGL